MNGCINHRFITFTRVKVVNEGGGIGDGGEGGWCCFGSIGVGGFIGGGCDWECGGVPSDDGFGGVATEVEGKHLTVEVFADRYFFVSAFGVGYWEAVCYFDLFVVLCE